MEILFVLIVIVIVAVYFSPFFLESLQASFPYYNTIRRIRYTIVFGGIGLLYAMTGASGDIKDMFFGMIAGSFIDLLLSQKTSSQ